MVIKNQKMLHDEDWRNIKTDYAVLANDKDISARMGLLVEFCRKNKPNRILDIGCGSGYLGFLIKKLFPEVSITGFDISEQAVSQAGSYDKVYTLSLDNEDIPEPENYFDMVICAEVIEHIYDIDHCLFEIKRVLSPSGRAIITTPNFSFWKYRIKCLLGRMPQILKDPRHVHTFTHDFLASKCYNTGFNVSIGINERIGWRVKVFESIFNNTIVAVLRKGGNE